jgi:hypothetical protein
MTTPTSFALSSNITVCDTLTFIGGISASQTGLTQPSLNLSGCAINGYVLPEGVCGYLLGSYDTVVNVFTVGIGNRALIWSGTIDQFSSVGKTGGDWQLAQ